MFKIVDQQQKLLMRLIWIIRKDNWIWIVIVVVRSANVLRWQEVRKKPPTWYKHEDFFWDKILFRLPVVADIDNMWVKGAGTWPESFLTTLLLQRWFWCDKTSSISSVYTTRISVSSVQCQTCQYRYHSHHTETLIHITHRYSDIDRYRYHPNLAGYWCLKFVSLDPLCH